MVLKKCQNCGAEYTVSDSQKDRSKYCCDKCFRQSKRKRTLYKCDYCSKEFLVLNSKIRDLNNGKRKHICCSTKCAQDIQKVNFDVVKNLFEQRGYNLQTDHLLKAKEKYSYICPVHSQFGTQSITYNNLKNGYGCKLCGHEATAAKRRNTFEHVKEIFSKQNLVLLQQEYINSAQKLKYICPKHKDAGVQTMSLSNAFHNGCPLCNASKGEKRISRFLDQYHISYLRQYKFDDLRGIGNRCLSYDFYLPDYNCLIEYQGEYHSVNKIPYGQTEQQKATQLEHDMRKRQYAQKNNYELIEIWFTDKQNIEKILYNKLIS